MEIHGLEWTHQEGRTLADASLAGRIKAGDGAAVSELHKAFSERIYFIALRELRSREDAEDVRNETLLRVIESVRAGKLASEAALAAFVVAIARNVIRESFRKKQRSEPLNGRDFQAAVGEPPVDHTVQRAIEATLGRLKRRERDFLRLYYYEELSKDEISLRLGVPEERVRLIKSRALKSFREVFQRLTDR